MLFTKGMLCKPSSEKCSLLRYVVQTIIRGMLFTKGMLYIHKPNAILLKCSLLFSIIFDSIRFYSILFLFLFISYSYSHTYSDSEAETIPAKPLHNHDIVSVHFNNFYCTEICNKLRRDLAMFTYNIS